MLALGLLIIGVLSRLIFHVPNFTPVLAIALFGGVYLKKKQAVILPVLILALSDLSFEYHNTVVFTWGSIILISLFGVWLRNHKKLSTITLTSIVSAFCFFSHNEFWGMVSDRHVCAHVGWIIAMFCTCCSLF